MNEMLLLGAGASIEAGVPGAFGMTGKIMEHFRNSPLLKAHASVISFVTGGLLFKKGIHGENPLTSGINVEELFNAVQLLSERNTIEAAPFIGSWHAMVEELDKVAPPAAQVHKVSQIIYRGVAKEILQAMGSSPPSFEGRDIDRNLQTTIQKTVEAMTQKRPLGSPRNNIVAEAIGKYVVVITKKWMERLKGGFGSNPELERELNKIADQQPRSADGRVFGEVGEAMIRALANFVWIEDTQKVTHLRPILSLALKQKRLCIATLNYDNSVELLTRDHGLNCSTGIEEWSNKGTFNSIQDGILLLKLHGSIDWESKENRKPDRPMPHRVISRTTVEKLNSHGFRPAVIFGLRNKLTAEGPFLDLLRAFRQELAAAQVLTVIGYSFADIHINEYISQWLNSNSQNKLRIIDPKFTENKCEYADSLRTYLKSRLEVIPEEAGKGLLQLFGKPADLPSSLLK